MRAAIVSREENNRIIKTKSDLLQESIEEIKGEIR